MKVEFDFLRRAYVANMHRRRALELRSIAGERSMSAVRQELDSEAGWNEEQARKLDDADDQSEKQETKPTKADARADLDYIDEKKGE